MVTVEEVRTCKVTFLHLSGKDHFVKIHVLAYSEMVREMAPNYKFGPYRELTLNI